MEKITGRALGWSDLAIALARIRWPAPTPLLVTMITVGSDMSGKLTINL